MTENNNIDASQGLPTLPVKWAQSRNESARQSGLPEPYAAISDAPERSLSDTNIDLTKGLPKPPVKWAESKNESARQRGLPEPYPGISQEPPKEAGRLEGIKGRLKSLFEKSVEPPVEINVLTGPTKIERVEELYKPGGVYPPEVPEEILESHDRRIEKAVQRRESRVTGEELEDLKRRNDEENAHRRQAMQQSQPPTVAPAQPESPLTPEPAVPVPTQAPSPVPPQPPASAEPLSVEPTSAPPTEPPVQSLDELPVVESVTSPWPPPPVTPVEQPPKAKPLFKIGERLPVAEEAEPEQILAQPAPQVEAAPPEALPLQEQPIQDIYPHLPIGKISPEILRDPDVVETLQVYDQVYGLFMEKDESELNPIERTARAIVEDKLKKIFASGKTLVHENRYPVTLPDGRISKVTFTEYLPADDMLEFLTKEILILKNSKHNPDLSQDEADSIQRTIDSYKQMQDKLVSTKNAVDKRLIKYHPDPRFTDRVKQEEALLLQFGPKHGLNLTEDEAQTLANDRINKRTDIRLFPKPKRQPQRSPARQPLPEQPPAPPLEAPSIVVEEAQQGIESQAAEVTLPEVEGYQQQHGFYYEQDIPVEDQVGIRIADGVIEARLTDGMVIELQKDNFIAEGENFRLDNLSDELKEIFEDPKNAEAKLDIQIAIMKALDKIPGIKEILPEKTEQPMSSQATQPAEAEVEQLVEPSEETNLTKKRIVQAFDALKLYESSMRPKDDPARPEKVFELMNLISSDESQDLDIARKEVLFYLLANEPTRRILLNGLPGPEQIAEAVEKLKGADLNTALDFFNREIEEEKRHKITGGSFRRALLRYILEKHEAAEIVHAVAGINDRSRNFWENLSAPFRTPTKPTPTKPPAVVPASEQPQQVKFEDLPFSDLELVTNKPLFEQLQQAMSIDPKRQLPLNQDSIGQFLPQVIRQVLNNPEASKYITNLAPFTPTIRFGEKSISFEADSTVHLTGAYAALSLGGKEKPVHISGRILIVNGVPRIVIEKLDVEKLRTLSGAFNSKKDKIIADTSSKDANTFIVQALQSSGVPVTNSRLEIRGGSAVLFLENEPVAS